MRVPVFLAASLSLSPAVSLAFASVCHCLCVSLSASSLRIHAAKQRATGRLGAAVAGVGAFSSRGVTLG